LRPEEQMSSFMARQRKPASMRWMLLLLLLLLSGSEKRLMKE
jgi:hypothetical protein